MPASSGEIVQRPLQVLALAVEELAWVGGIHLSSGRLEDAPDDLHVVEQAPDAGEAVADPLPRLSPDLLGPLGIGEEVSNRGAVAGEVPRVSSRIPLSPCTIWSWIPPMRDATTGRAPQGREHLGGTHVRHGRPHRRDPRP
jgi:hypothetical protein